MYIILNLCRVLAYKKSDLILSKQEGGEWGLASVPKKFRNLIIGAMGEYKTGKAMDLDELIASEFVGYMLTEIRM